MTCNIVFHWTLEFRVGGTRNSTGFYLESYPDLEFQGNSAGIPGLFLLGNVWKRKL